MDINRDQVVAMFAQFDPSALASFLAAAQRAVKNESVNEGLLSLIGLARYAGREKVGGTDFAAMVDQPIKRHGLTGHELSVLFTVDRMAHAADLQVKPGLIEYLVTLHDPSTSDDQVTRVSIHTVKTMTDHAAWLEAHSLADHFGARLHTVSRVVEPITERGAEVIGDFSEIEVDNKLVVTMPNEGVELSTLTVTLAPGAILAWLDKHEPGPESPVLTYDPGDYLLTFNKPGEVDTYLYTQINAPSSVDMVRVARAIAGRFSLTPVRIRHNESGHSEIIPKANKQ